MMKRGETEQEQQVFHTQCSGRPNFSCIYNRDIKYTQHFQLGHKTVEKY